jgi:hypothetical protein
MKTALIKAFTLFQLLQNFSNSFLNPFSMAEGSRLLHPIHGRGVFQRPNIISNLKGSMAAWWPPEAACGT